MKNFYNNCVNWPQNDVETLLAMTESGKEVTRETFLNNVNKKEMREIEKLLGYSVGYEKDGLTMARDWHVAYYKGKLRGRPCMYFVHSAIEYVFV